METPPPYGQTLATVAAGRTAAVAQLRQLAAALEALPLDAVAEVLVLRRTYHAARADRPRRRWRPEPAPPRASRREWPSSYPSS